MSSMHRGRRSGQLTAEPSSEPNITQIQSRPTSLRDIGIVCHGISIGHIIKEVKHHPIPFHLYYLHIVYYQPYFTYCFSFSFCLYIAHYQHCLIYQPLFTITYFSLFTCCLFLLHFTADCRVIFSYWLILL